MTRLHRLVSGLSLIALVAAGAAFVAPPSHATASRHAITVYDIASQLGLSTAPMYEGEDFTLGVQFTGTLKDPAKLAAFGLTDFHAGARVVAAFIAPTVIYVEADEQEPQHKQSVRLRIAADGSLALP